MTRVQVTYVAIDEYKKPIATASKFEELEKGLDAYFGVHMDSGKNLGFKRYDTKYPDDFEGYFTYETKDRENDYVETVNVYCVDYYPHTIYEDNDSKRV